MGDVIDINALRDKNETLNIAPARESYEYEIAPDRAAQAIKSLDDIYRIKDYLLSKGRYRDHMLFIVGINFGLRASDLRVLRFGNLINDNNTFKDVFPVFEKKTRNTRKRKKNRYITINNAVKEAVTLYLKMTPGLSLSDYMFVSESRNIGKDCKRATSPLTVRSIERILEGITKDLQLNIHLSSHSLRKTFCYHQMVMSGNSYRKLLLLQKMLNHSSPNQTLDYIGITSDEIDEAYRALNLGSNQYCYLVESDICDSISEVV